MLLASRQGVTILDAKDRANIDWISDLFVKALCGAITLLLAFAVHSLNTMNAEIKELSSHVFELSSHTKVINVNLDSLKEKIKKLEGEVEALRAK